MKNTRTFVVLAVAILSGLMAVMLAARWLDHQSSTGITRIAVAATEISLGQRLTPELVKLVDWPKDSLPPGSHADIRKLEGRVLKSALQRGEPVLDAKLAPVGTQGGLSAVIAEGKRAITVRVQLCGHHCQYAKRRRPYQPRPEHFEDRARKNTGAGSGTRSQPRRNQATRGECRDAGSHT